MAPGFDRVHSDAAKLSDPRFMPEAMKSVGEVLLQVFREWPPENMPETAATPEWRDEVLSRDVAGADDDQRCEYCGSYERSSHPHCSYCCSDEHEHHPRRGYCGSHDHDDHPRCLSCGSYEHDDHGIFLMEENATMDWRSLGALSKTLKAILDELNRDGVWVVHERDFFGFSDEDAAAMSPTVQRVSEAWMMGFQSTTASLERVLGLKERRETDSVAWAERDTFRESEIIKFGEDLVSHAERLLAAYGAEAQQGM